MAGSDSAIVKGDETSSADEITELQREISLLKQKIKEEKVGAKLATDKHSELQKRSEKLRLEISEKDRQLIDKDAYISDLKRQKSILAKEVEEHNAKRKYKVQILCKDDHNVMAEVANAFVKSLDKHKAGPEICVIRCMKASEIQTNMPLILLCFDAKNVARELQQVIQGITAFDRTAVIVVHLAEDTVQLTKDIDDVARNRQLCSLGGIFDLEFTRDKGLSAGRLNSKTVENIISFVKSKA